MNITQELNNARNYLLKGIECLNNVETVFGISPQKTGTPNTNPGVITMTTPRRTLTPAGRRKIAKAQKARWAERKAGTVASRVAV